VDASLDIGGQLGYWTLVPFALMLLGVAILPLACGHWFEHNRNKAIFAAVLGVPTIIYLLVRFGDTGLHLTGKTVEEYISFIILLVALFAISGGIYLTGNAIATPRHNLAYLALGAVLANFIGTMGASMVLIRPLLKANSDRTYSRHTMIFFIFAVSNIGGMLTPLGDPPLFLGFLNEVPFEWTLRLWPQWLLTVGLVLLVYMALEIYYYRKEPREALCRDAADYVPMRIKGWINVIPLALVIATVACSKYLGEAGEAIGFPFVREVILVILAIISLRICPRAPRLANVFKWAPMIEVAVLFAGIFATMIPALALLEARGAALGLTQPWQYFWASGGLSSFLDNAPTYLTFTSVAQGQMAEASGQVFANVGALTSPEVISSLGFSPAQFLAAISCGAVMMGANTYIGNAPNFAVKCIAESHGVKMPSFFGYMAYSCAVLLPIFAIVTVIFFL
jgi:Na+/H+ antiporter NhaD/arsenite permease-like protein